MSNETGTINGAIAAAASHAFSPGREPSGDPAICTSCGLGRGFHAHPFRGETLDALTCTLCGQERTFRPHGNAAPSRAIEPGDPDLAAKLDSIGLRMPEDMPRATGDVSGPGADRVDGIIRAVSESRRDVVLQSILKRQGQDRRSFEDYRRTVNGDLRRLREDVNRLQVEARAPVGSADKALIGAAILVVNTPEGSEARTNAIRTLARVLAGGGAPVPGVRVEVEADDGRVASWTTDADGRHHLD